MKNGREKIKYLQELAEVYNSKNYGAYRQVIEQIGLSGEFKKILMKRNDEWRYAKNVERQMEMLEMLEKVIEGLKAKVMKIGADYDKAKEEYEKAKKKYDIATRIQKFQEEKMAKAKRKMEEVNRHKITIKNDINEMENALKQNEKKLKKMQRFTLIHSTATLVGIDKRHETVLVCTKYDVERMKFDRFVDEVEDTSFYDLDIPYGAREKFATEQEFESAIEYVKLVIRYWAEDRPYDLLYNCEGIKYMLEEILK